MLVDHAYVATTQAHIGDLPLRECRLHYRLPRAALEHGCEALYGAHNARQLLIVLYEAVRGAGAEGPPPEKHAVDRALGVPQHSEILGVVRNEALDREIVYVNSYIELQRIAGASGSRAHTRICCRDPAGPGS